MHACAYLSRGSTYLKMFARQPSSSASTLQLDLSHIVDLQIRGSKILTIKESCYSTVLNSREGSNF